ncbi:MAG TPA: ABC transporter substrate-binding protein, partial [Aggregatilineales bacterium]|nr:ABC transporter substrate-binding protein [Aggregatilineales bacterium]
MKKLSILMVLVSLVMGMVFISSAQEATIELDFVHIFSDDLRPGVLQGIIDEYQSLNPNVKINAYSTNAESDYDEVFNSAMANADLGNAPSIVQVEDGLTQQAIDYGYYVPVSDYATEEQLATLDDVFPSILGYFIEGETLWSMPWNISNPVLYYNKDMFEAAGLDPENPPTTFAEIDAACEAIMTAIPELRACMNWAMSSWYVEQWLAMSNEAFVNNDNGRSGRATEALFTSQTMLDIVTWWDSLDGNGYFTYNGRLNDMNGEGATFLTGCSGKAMRGGCTAMTINSTAGITLIQGYSKTLGFQLGIGRLPAPSDTATNGVTIGGGSLFVSVDQSDEEIQASVDFIFFLTNTENAAKWHQGTGYMPVRQSSFDLSIESGFYDENPFFRIAIDQLSETTPNFASAGAVLGPNTAVKREFLTTMQELMNGE